MRGVFHEFGQPYKVSFVGETNYFVELVKGVNFLENRLWAVDGRDILLFLNRWTDLLVFSVGLLQPQQVVECDFDGDHDICIELVVQKHF
jgi:hypothetical protein